MTLPVEKFDPFRQVSTRSGLGSWPVCFAGGRWFGLPDFRLCGRACGVAVGFFLEKQLASLRHLFPAKNPTATPRRRALAGIRLKRTAVAFALRAGSGQFDAKLNRASGYSRCFSPSAFLYCTSVGGCGVFFWQGKRCLSEASCFSQKKNTPYPPYPPLNQQARSPSNPPPPSQRAQSRTQTTSMATAVASPPPMHSDATPRLRPRCLRALIRVMMIREPDEPIGWPRAQAPPCTLTFSAGNFNSLMAARVTTAKASLISNRSTSSNVQPAFFSTFSIEPIGAGVNSAGKRAWVAWATILAWEIGRA